MNRNSHWELTRNVERKRGTEFENADILDFTSSLSESK